MIELKSEPYSDTDKLADDAIEELNSLELGYGAHTVIGMALGKLKAFEGAGLTPEEIMDGRMLTGWIPVEEQLPDENGTYHLVSTTSSHRIEMAWYLNGKWYWNNSDVQMKRVNAWMPLPEPYKPKEDSHDR